MTSRRIARIAAVIAVFGYLGLSTEEVSASPSTSSNCGEQFKLEMLAGGIDLANKSRLRQGHLSEELSEAGASLSGCSECVWLCVANDDECNRNTCELFGCSSGIVGCLEDWMSCSDDQPDLLYCLAN